MEVDIAKTNMIKQQIRTWNVLDERILDAYATTPREDFVPLAYHRLAFAETNIPLDHQQVMMAPSVEAKMLEVLRLQPNDKVLEIGTGSGFVTALLAKLTQHVYSVDIYPDFIEQAQQRLAKQHLTNVTLQEGNAATGWEKQQPYDVICVTASMPQLPDALRQQLKIGGRLFAIIGSSPAMEATLIQRKAENTWEMRKLFETVIPPLVDAPEKKHFQF